MPKVSVILTSYNHEKYIAAAIESTLNQTFSDFELLIVDDGSTDNSHKIIKSFKDARIKHFLNKENTGAVQMLQLGLKVATGEFIAVHHSDDVWESTKLEKQIQFLENNPEYIACFTQAKFIDEYGKIYELPENHHYKNVFKQKNRSREEWLNHLFWKANCFCHPSILARNQMQYFSHNPALFQLPDYFTWVKLLQQKNIYVMEEELTLFRIRRGVQNSVSSWSLEKLIRVNNEEYFVAKEFLPILCDEKFFLKVFPEAEKFLIDGKISTKFAFAQLCIERNSPAFRTLALELLYDLLHNENICQWIKKLYGYDEKSFIKDTGKFDVFGISLQLKFLNCRLYIDSGKNFNEKEIINHSTPIRNGENFSVNFNFKSDKQIQRLRFDPAEKPALAVRIDKISVNGKIITNFISNAIQVIGNCYYFITADPFFIIDKKISKGEIQVEITGSIKQELSPEFQKFEQYRNFQKSSLDMFKELKNKFFK